jgi:membrane fusion protein
MPQNLFRPEVLQERQASWLGGIRMGKNPGFSLVAGAALTLAGALVAFAAWGQVARKARIPGVLMPVQGTVQLSANAAGVLTDQLVQEGEQVSAGQALFVLGTDRPTAEGSAAVLLAAHLAQRRSTLEAERTARVQQTRQRETALQDRIRALDHEIAQAQQEALLASRRVALAQKTLGRYQQMAQEGFVSDIQAQNKQEELIDLQARVENTQRNAATLQREQQSLQAEREANQRQLSIDLAQLDRALVSLAQEGTENQSRKTIVITAPQAGVVSTIHLPKGAAVQASQNVATLVPVDSSGTDTAGSPAQLQAHLYAPSRTAGFIQPGQTVWMRYGAYPYQKFGLAQGLVQSISATPTSPQDLPNGQSAALQTAAQTQEPLYRIQVQLKDQHISAYGDKLSLKPGMTLEADVVQERRAVWEWIFEPVLAARQKVKVL